MPRQKSARAPHARLPRAAARVRRLRTRRRAACNQRLRGRGGRAAGAPAAPHVTPPRALTPLPRALTPPTGNPQVVIALGSNQGDRAALLQAALRALPAAGVAVHALSSLYESAAAYVTDQARPARGSRLARRDRARRRARR
jgi:hypothetical protein